MEANLTLAIFITLFAGLSTGIGGLIVYFSNKINLKLLSAALGFSAGVMIYVSFMELIPEALTNIQSMYNEKWAYIYMVIAFFTGIFFIAIIDRFVPETDNPHEYSKIKDEQTTSNHYKRVGLFTALAIAIHNFPEGLATFISSYNDITIGISIAIAVAIHNIPEGISVAIPIFYATKNKRKAFLTSLYTGLAEPIGALIGFSILLPFISPVIMGIVFAFVAGIMIYISIDELLPSAEKFGHHHLSIYGLILGMIIMAISFILLK
jgi:ZIP family zinc transporter